MIINANEVKTKGVLLGKVLQTADETVINVRGKNKYAVLDIERYNEFRQNKLDVVHMKVTQDIKDGRYKAQTAAEHTKELLDQL